MIDRMIERKLHQFKFWKDFLKFYADEFIQAVIVIDMQEPTTDQVFSQVCCFGFGEYHVTVSSHIYIWIEKQITAAYFNDIFLWLQICTKFLVAEFDQV